MIESMIKVSRVAGQLASGPDVGVRDDDTAPGTLTCLSARKKSVTLLSDSSTTLCFVRGTGKIAVRDASVEYRDGKWFEIPCMTAYQIFPNTDTVLLTIQKPGRALAKQGKKHFAEGCSSVGRSSGRT